MDWISEGTRAALEADEDRTPFGCIVAPEKEFLTHEGQILIRTQDLKVGNSSFKGQKLKL